MMNYYESEHFLKLADDKVADLAKRSWNDMMQTYSAFDICDNLVKCVKNSIGEESDAYTYGDRTIGINMSDKFLVFLDIGRRRFYADRNKKENKRDINMLDDLLRKDPNWRVLKKNPLLPTLHVIYLPSNEKCEISVTNGLSVQFSNLIGHFYEMQPEAVKFYHFIRVWLEINNIRFKSLVTNLLVIHYLQVNNMMPSAHRAQKNVIQDYIDGVAINFDSTRDLTSYGVRKMHYYYSFVRGFLRYYSNFDYKNYIISTYHGYPIKKIEYTNPRIDFDSPMCIAAFINQRNNCSRRVSQQDLNDFIHVCESSYNLLASSEY